MSSDKQSSVLVSDTTSPSEPHLDARGSESDFLDRQAEEAHLAISETLSRLGERLKDLGDVKEWTKEYPLAAVGSAGLVGFLVARSMVSAKRLKPVENETAEVHGSSQLSSILSVVVQMATTAALGALQNAMANGVVTRHDVQSPPRQCDNTLV